MSNCRKWIGGIAALLGALTSHGAAAQYYLGVEAGLALGKIRERKATTNVTMSGYDEDKWRPGVVAGLGMSLALDERWSLRVGYRRTWYKDHDFDTYRADGTQVEAVTSRVVQSTTTIGLIREFLADSMASKSRRWRDGANIGILDAT